MAVTNTTYKGLLRSLLNLMQNYSPEATLDDVMTGYSYRSISRKFDDLVEYDEDVADFQREYPEIYGTSSGPPPQPN